MQILENDKIRLRALEPEDIDILYAWENDNEIWEVSNTQTPFSKHLLRKFIEQSHLDIYQTKQLKLFCECKNGEKPIGLIDLFNIDVYHSKAEIGILIQKNKCNKGYATECINVFTHYVFKVLGLHQLYCHIATVNTASLAVFKKLGYEVIGIKKDWEKDFNDWTDIVFMQKINDLK